MLLCGVFNSVGSVGKFRSCRRKCLNLFSDYKCYDSVAGMLYDTGPVCLALLALNGL